MQTPVQTQTQSLAAAPEDDPLPDDAQVEAALLLALVSPDVPGLARAQQQLYQTASQLRERLSVDNWRALNRLAQRANAGTALPLPSEAMAILDDAATTGMLMSGFALDGMNRDLGWRFLSIGRRLERLQFLSVALQRALLMEPNANLDWMLELADSIVTYRSRYRAQPEWLPLLDLLVLDASNPRSILFQVDGILKGMKKLALSYAAGDAEALAALRAELLELAPESDLYCGNAHLIDLLYRIQVASNSLSEHLSVQFFSYTGKQPEKDTGA